MHKTGRMKLTFAAVPILAIALTAGAGDANAAKKPRSTITLNPIELVNGLLSFEAETAPFDMLSLHAGMQFLVEEALHPDDNSSAFAIGPEIGARLFVFGDAPEGFWVGPFAGLAFVSGKNNFERSGDLGFNTGAMAGMTMLFFDQMIVSAGAGVGYHNFSTMVGEEEVGLRGWSPRLRLSVGMAF